MKHWSLAEETLIRTLSPRVKDEDLIHELFKLSGRIVGLGALRKQRARLGIKKQHGRGICKLVENISKNFGGK